MRLIVLLIRFAAVYVCILCSICFKCAFDELDLFVLFANVFILRVGYFLLSAADCIFIVVVLRLLIACMILLMLLGWSLCF